ncbi:alpha/beta hydrolase [Acidimicrobiia bacterium]|nr:alpha/beta hydrolase [Acidimicrobiia bacterium]
MKKISLLICLALVASCGGSSETAPTTTTEPPTTTTETPTTTTETPITVPSPYPYEPQERSVTERECEGGNSPRYTCFWIEVPLLRDGSTDETLRIAVTKIDAESNNPLPDPAIYLSGGPGYDGGNPGTWAEGSVIAKEREVILFDPRGTGFSDPNLNCPEWDTTLLETFITVLPHETALTNMSNAASDCHERLLSEGIVLEAFNTPEIARDVADIRVSLGYPEWNLLGISYGGRLANELMRTDPTGTRTAILDSVYTHLRGGVWDLANSGEMAKNVFFEACSNDESCRWHFPDIEQTFVSIREDLDANPPVVPIEVNGQPLEAQVSSVEGWSGIYQALYEENQIALLPFLAVALQMNSTDMLSPIFSDGYASALGLGDGMSMSVECSELPYSWDLEKETEIIENPGDWAKKVSTSHRSYCSVWPVELVNPHFAEPVISEIPALGLAGAFDPIAPPSYTIEVTDDWLGNLLGFDGIYVWIGNSRDGTVSRIYAGDFPCEAPTTTSITPIATSTTPQVSRGTASYALDCIEEWRAIRTSAYMWGEFQGPDITNLIDSCDVALREIELDLIGEPDDGSPARLLEDLLLMIRRKAEWKSAAAGLNFCTFGTCTLSLQEERDRFLSLERGLIFRYLDPVPEAFLFWIPGSGVDPPSLDDIPGLRLADT